MYSCIHLLLRIEPDLCEVVTGAGPADQLAFQGAIWHIVTDRCNVIGGSDDGVLISVT